MSRDDFKFSHNGSHLAVLVDLDQRVADEFEDVCEKLLSFAWKEVVIDLTQIRYISSVCLGELILVNDRCNDTGRKLRVVIPKHLVTIFDLLSMRDFIETEIVE